MMHIGWIATLLKRAALRNFHDSAVLDDLKRRIFDRPVVVHTSDLTPDWEYVKRRAAKAIRAAVVQPPKFGERFALKTIYIKSYLTIGYLRHLYAKANSQYVNIKRHLTIGYMRHLYAIYRLRLAHGRNSAFAKANSKYVHIKSHLTIGYMRHVIYVVFRHYVSSRQQIVWGLQNQSFLARRIMRRLGMRRE